MPKRLKEAERRKLARYFGIAESLLGGASESDPALDNLVAVQRVPVRAAAGAGAVAADPVGSPYFAFDQRWLKALTATPAEKLTIIRVEGDSMAPTLSPGDDILLDPSDCADQIRDGIYVLRVDDSLVVKRLALNPIGGRVTVQSDNPAYSDWPDCDIGEIHCIGRVIWAGRRID